MVIGVFLFSFGGLSPPSEFLAFKENTPVTQQVCFFECQELCVGKLRGGGGGGGVYTKRVITH